MELQQQTLDKKPHAEMRYVHTDGAVVRMHRQIDALLKEQAVAFG